MSFRGFQMCTKYMYFIIELHCIASRKKRERERKKEKSVTRSIPSIPRLDMFRSSMEKRKFIFMEMHRRFLLNKMDPLFRIIYTHTNILTPSKYQYSSIGFSQTITQIWASIDICFAPSQYHIRNVKLFGWCAQVCSRDSMLSAWPVLVHYQVIAMRNKLQTVIDFKVEIDRNHRKHFENSIQNAHGINKYQAIFVINSNPR